LGFNREIDETWHQACVENPQVTDTCMIDRESVLAVLQKRFPGSASDQVAAAANAIVGLGDDWVDVTAREAELGYHFSVQCGEICFLADQAQRGSQFRLFMKKSTDG
jgi:hypothetical protein